MSAGWVALAYACAGWLAVEALRRAHRPELSAAERLLAFALWPWWALVFLAAVAAELAEMVRERRR